jgi:hypothetical protein
MKDLIIEIQCMWSVKAKVISVITGGDWNHLKITQDNTSATYQESTKLRDYKKTVILGTAQILWKVPM